MKIRDLKKKKKMESTQMNFEKELKEKVLNVETASWLERPFL